MTDHQAEPKRGSIVRKLGALTMGCLVGGICLELACWAMVQSGRVDARVPSYSLQDNAVSFWGDLSPEFGVWHPVNTRYRHQKACFDVVYESNSYGARDVERPRESAERRVVVLGDSFMEGYGVASSARVSNQLESTTGVPHLNFGTSGDAGPTHAFALYRALASEFDHDAVLAAILPENDFDDDEPSQNRYRLHWEGTYPDYTLKTSLTSISDSSWQAKNGRAGFSLTRLLREYTYTRNVVDYLYSASKQRRADKKLRGEIDLPPSRFFDYTEEQLLRMCHSYEQLAELAAPRPVVLFTIPRAPDIFAYATEGESPLDEALVEWAAGIENLEVVPLLPELLRRHGSAPIELFLQCDAHWSPAGHQAAAEVLLDEAGITLYGQ